MKYEKDWALQESSCRRPEDGLREPCRIAFAGVTLALLESIPPSCEKNDQDYHAILHFREPSLMTWPCDFQNT